MCKKDWRLLQAYKATGLTPEGVATLQKELEWKDKVIELAQRTQAEAEAKGQEDAAKAFRDGCRQGFQAMAGEVIGLLKAMKAQTIGVQLALVSELIVAVHRLEEEHGSEKR